MAGTAAVRRPDQRPDGVRAGRLRARENADETDLAVHRRRQLLGSAQTGPGRVHRLSGGPVLADGG